MDTSQHTMRTLFDQLGLASEETAIEDFIRDNPLSANIPLDQAAFWSSGQAQFIREALEDDSDWAEIVDQLDARLRR